MPRHSVSRLEKTRHRTEQLFVKLIVGALVACVLLGVGIVGGRHAFRRWQEHRLVDQAHAFLARDNDKMAATAASRAYELNPGNIEACRVLATIAEKHNILNAVEWRRRVYELPTATLDDALLYAKVSLQFGDKIKARAVLEKVASKASDIASYHESAAQLAVLDNDPAAAEMHFSEAARIEPAAKRHSLNLAIFRLQTRRQSDLARETLKSFLEDLDMRMPAARALMQEAMKGKESGNVVEIAKRIVSFPEATLQDRFGVLPILRQVDADAFAQYLTATQAYAREDVLKVSEVIAWMSANQLALLGLEWARRLPQQMLSNERIRMALSECHATLHDWSTLKAFCKKPGWNGYEHFRHAYLARAARALGNQLEEKIEWNAAIKTAGSDSELTGSLARLALQWHWTHEGEELLWRLADDPRNQASALSALYEFYKENDDAANLYRVSRRLSEAHPDDLYAENNVAQLSLLLNLNAEAGRNSARRLHEKEPANAVFASTYAFALYTQNRHADAVKVMNALTPEQLSDPGVAAYYGIFLVAAGETAKAPGYLQVAESARLLPEEKILLSKAKAQLAAR